MNQELGRVFNGVLDPRSHRNRRYKLTTILSITLLGGLSGIDSFSGLADFTEAHREELEKYLDLPNQNPSHDTFQRILSAISPSQFYNSFTEFTEQLLEIKEGVINIDGKTIRNSGKNPLHIVTAWCEANQLVLAQEKVPENGNEITVIPRLLRLLDLENRIVTIDAIGCQREICKQIEDQQGDYLITVKKNQKSLYEDIEEYFIDQAFRVKCLSWKEYDKGHGRFEERHAYVTDDIGWLQERHNWPGLRSMGMVVSKRTQKSKTTTDTRYYISSLPANAEQLCKTARSHWCIENKLHWRLDVVFNEDKACITNDNAAEIMNIVRKWALNILQKAKEKPDQSIRSVQRKASMSFKYLTKVISKIFHA